MEPRNYTEEIDLQKYWLVLRRRWFAGSVVFLASIGLGVLASSLQEPVYKANGKLLFRPDRTPALTGVGEKIGELESLKQEGNPLDTQAVIVQSSPILEEAIARLEVKAEDGTVLTPETLLPALTVTPVVGTDVLEVSYQSEDPKLAAAVVNQIMKSYINNDVLTNRAETVAAGKFIAQQLPRTEAEVNAAAEELRRFKAQNQIVTLEQEATAVVGTLTSLDNQINQARAELADVVARSGALRQQVGMPTERAVDVTSLNQIPGVQEALKELQLVQSELATARARYRDRHPAIAKLQRREAELNNLLQQRITQAIGSADSVSPGDLQIGELRQTLTANFVELEVQRLGLERRINALSDLRNVYKQEANLFPTLEKKQQELERRLLAAQTTYENLLNRLQEIRVAENQNIGNARVIQAAKVPEETVGPSKAVYVAGGAFVGLFLGLAVAFLIDMVDRSVKTVKEAQALFGYTLLGLIPRFEIPDSVDVDDPVLEGVSPRIVLTGIPRSPIHDAYQMLQANLKFISSDKKIRTIVVTSSVPREGKSEVCANLAAAMAQVGRRVLVVDADMRYPTQHHIWGLVNSVGLSHVMVNQAEFSEAVQTVSDRLSVLTAGVIPPNPLALLDSERMHSLINLFTQDYDYILFDTPPLAGTADAAVLGKMADGVLLVVQPGVVDSASAAAAKSLLERSEPNVLGIVANGINVKQEPDSYFYYTNPRLEHNIEKIDSGRSSRTISVE